MIRSVLQQRLSSFKKNWALQFSTLVVVTACYLVVTISVLLSQNLRKILTVWGEDLQMTVYLTENSEAEEIKELQNKIQSDKNIGKVKFVSKETALSDFRGQMASYAPDILNEKDLLSLIPASLQVSLSDSVGAMEHVRVLDSLATLLKSEKTVAEVSYGQDWVQKYSRFLFYFQRACEAVGIIILGAALFVLSNVIRASVQSRRQEIEVLELIGATPSMIRRPFLMEGATLGLVSSALAVGFSYLMFSGISGMFQRELQFLQLAEHLKFLSPALMIAFCLVGAGLGAVASYLCVRQINDGWAARGI
ncbi:MAG: ABC transporter permease [Bdellovibrionaceae bacterium]|nr:ABC transporter permease [Pseudobdellovibrionaceae bacterium]